MTEFYHHIFGELFLLRIPIRSCRSGYVLGLMFCRHEDGAKVEQKTLLRQLELPLFLSWTYWTLQSPAPYGKDVWNHYISDNSSKSLLHPVLKLHLLLVFWTLNYMKVPSCFYFISLCKSPYCAGSKQYCYRKCSCHLYKCVLCAFVSNLSALLQLCLYWVDVQTGRAWVPKATFHWVIN